MGGRSSALGCVVFICVTPVVSLGRIVTFDPSIHNASSRATVSARVVVGTSVLGGVVEQPFTSIVHVNTSTGGIKFDDFRTIPTTSIGGGIQTETCDIFGNCDRPITAWLNGDIVIPEVTGSTEWLSTSPPIGRISMPASGFPAEISGTLNWLTRKDDVVFGSGSFPVTF